MRSRAARGASDGGSVEQRNRAAAARALLDRGLRAGMRAGYLLSLAYWRLVRPRTEGSCVLVWCEGRLLMVRHSYKPGLAIPGGAPRPSEAPRDTAVRELEEEVGLRVDPRTLVRLGQVESRYEGKRDLLMIFETELADPPRLRADGREVVWAALDHPDAHAASELWPPLPAILALSPRYLGTRSRSGQDRAPLPGR